MLTLRGLFYTNLLSTIVTMTLKSLSLLSISILCIFMTWCTNISYNTSDKKIENIINNISDQTQCIFSSTGWISDWKNTWSYNCSLLSWTGTATGHKNILWQPLQSCSTNPITGYERDGYCKTWPQDPANHSVCAVLTDEFLQHTLAQGNDLISPNPRYQFPWLKAWDHRCLCAARRYEAYRAGIVTEIITGATNSDATKVIPWFK